MFVYICTHFVWGVHVCFGEKLVRGGFLPIDWTVVSVRRDVGSGG